MTDEELRRRFGELRKREPEPPGFHKMWSARPRRSPWRIAIPLASVAAAAMVVLWCGRGVFMTAAPATHAAAPRSASPLVLEAAPLDFLLDTGNGRAPSAVVLDSNPLARW